MAKIRNTKNCSYMIGEVNLTPEFGELEIDDKRAAELCKLDGIEVVNYDEFEVPVLAISDPMDVSPIPENDTTVKKRRGRPRGKHK